MRMLASYDRLVSDASQTMRSVSVPGLGWCGGIMASTDMTAKKDPPNSKSKKAMRMLADYEALVSDMF